MRRRPARAGPPPDDAGQRRASSDALAAYKAGDKARAYKLARDAYLDHFEFVEIPLRLRNPNLVLDTEFTFAEMRNHIRSGALRRHRARLGA